LEVLRSPESVRVFAWSGLQYTGPDDDPDRASRTRLLAGSVDQLRALQQSGRLPAEVDPACLMIMLMAAAMATTTLPHVIEGICGVDPKSPEFVEHFADQVAVVARLIGLEPA
jgi:TetR/AcrR family transcriptional regulator